jgi:hypothetical protein
MCLCADMEAFCRLIVLGSSMWYDLVWEGTLDKGGRASRGDLSLL